MPERNPAPFTFKWWMREARWCEQDGHPSAAMCAYAQAMQCAPGLFEREIAKALLEGMCQE